MLATMVELTTSQSPGETSGMAIALFESLKGQLSRDYDIMQNYHFGGTNMPVEVANTISSVGTFLGGLGLLLLSFGLFWFVDVYKKSKK